MLSLVVGTHALFATSGFLGGPPKLSPAATRPPASFARTFAGVTEPLGFWDPLGVVADGDAGRIHLLREVELKHGRIVRAHEIEPREPRPPTRVFAQARRRPRGCRSRARPPTPPAVWQAMLACVGFVCAEQYHPLFSAVDAPSALAFQSAPLQTLWATLLAISLLEISALEVPAASALLWPLVSSAEAPSPLISAHAAGSRVPGDLGFDPLRLKPSSPDALLTRQNQEINHGRLAMVAITGMVTQELVTGTKLF